jgi:hypothetical protein
MKAADSFFLAVYVESLPKIIVDHHGGAENNLDKLRNIGPVRIRGVFASVSNLFFGTE